MWELEHKEGWVGKNWCFWTVVLEKTLEILLDCKEIQPVHPKGNQSLVFIGKTDIEAEAPIIWPPDVKSWHLKTSWYWERLRAGREGDVRGWGVWTVSSINGHGFTPKLMGVGDGQGGLVCCDSWDNKELDMNEWLNWTEHPLKGDFFLSFFLSFF